MPASRPGPAYDSDEIMAKLGRDCMDMLAGQRAMGRSDATIAPGLLQAVSEVLAEDETPSEQAEAEADAQEDEGCPTCGTSMDLVSKADGTEAMECPRCGHEDPL